MAANVKEQVPPHDLRAECAVIGAVLIDSEDLPDVVRDLEPSEFYSTGHRTIWAVIRGLMARSSPVDIVILREELERHGELEKAGGVESLYALSEAVPTTANADHYARIVRELASKRHLREIGLGLVEASNNGIAVVDLLRDHEDRLDAVRDRCAGRAGPLVHAAAIIGETISGYMPPALATGIRSLDLHLGGGFRPGFAPVTGRWGRGKTTWCNQLIATAAAGQVPSFFISLEDSIARQAAVMVSRLCSVDSKEIGTGKYTDEPTQSAAEKARLVEQAYAYYRKELDPWISFTSEARLSHLERLVTEWARRHANATHRILLLDTAHTVAVDGDSAVERMDRVAATFKRLQMDHGLITLATCHMNRAGQIRDSTEFEFKADLLIHVEAEDPDHPDAEDKTLDEYCRVNKTVCIRFIVAKDKVAGMTGEVPLVFRKPFGEFTGRAR